MASGLFALLDDIALLARATAMSLDDVALGAAKATVKTSGVIIDDAAVTPQYVKGISPARELPIVWKITVGSLRNKFIFVVPGIMLLSWLAPWVFPYLLIVGGLYLVYEGGQKILSWLHLVKEHGTHGPLFSDPNFEKKTVNSAVRTDLVLSMEIMLISLSNVETDNWVSQLLMLILVGLAMTLFVYGAVAILVKLDDIGLNLVRRKNRNVRLFGLGIIQSMPLIFRILSAVGTFAMLWVGGHLLWKNLGDVGLQAFHDSLHWLEETVHEWPALLAWSVDTLASMLLGLVIGVALGLALLLGKRLIPSKEKNRHDAEN